MKILEVRAYYEEDGEQLNAVAVLVDFTSSQSKPGSDVRAIVATKKPVNGYTSIPDGQELNNDFIKEVANYGCEVGNILDVFPGWRKKFIK